MSDFDQRLAGLEITHDMAREVASRLIAGSFRRSDKKPRFTIPTRHDDDDVVIVEYIRRQKAINDELAAERERAERLETDRREAVENAEAITAERDTLRAELAAERERAATLFDTIERTIASRFNAYLCEMQEGFDDSVSGLNDAWGVVNNALKDMRARIDAALGGGDD